MRVPLISCALLLAGCFGADPVCEDPAIDRCDSLSQWPLSQASYSVAETTTVTMDFRESNAERPRTLRLSCETDGDLEACVRSWVMPDLDRLPHAEARLLGIEPPADVKSGTFRIDDVATLSDGESVRVSGRVDELRFDTDDEILVIANGAFDVLAQEVP